MADIRILDEKTANQIAAGEVVERPASVVKELVENSLDAGAARVSVTLGGGGADLIQVVDDGAGIAHEQLPLALLRHATSKIRSAEDLHALTTLGFRGEALPSIASVSRFEIVSRRAEDLAATRVVVEGGVQRAVEETAAPPGTRVTVRNLFYNVPARLKFLRSRSSELSQAADAVTRLALARPEVAFRLEAEGRALITTPGSGRFLEAVRGTAGGEIAAGLIPLPGTEESASPGGLRVSGYIGKPELSRVSRNHQYFFVNGRAIRSAALRYPLEEAFRGRLTTGRYPVAFVFIEVDPSQVDVNVHPAKLEVRFGREGEVKAAIYRGVQDALGPAGAAGHVPPAFSRTSAWSPLSAGEAVGPYIVPSQLAPSPPSPASLAASLAAGPISQPEIPSVWDQVMREGAEDGRSYGAPIVPSFPAAKVDPLIASLRPLGRFRETYIVAEGNDGLYLIDQHAAHERVFFEMIREMAAAAQPASQYLALPIDLDLGPAGPALLAEYQGELEKAGFEVKPFGGNTILVKAVPPFLCLGNSILVRDFFDRLVESGDGRASLGRTEEVFWAIAACRAAVKARDQLSPAEMSGILAQLAAAGDPYHCPHGRPTLISLPAEDVERRFRRRA